MLIFRGVDVEKTYLGQIVTPPPKKEQTQQNKTVSKIGVQKNGNVPCQKIPHLCFLLPVLVFFLQLAFFQLYDLHSTDTY